MTATQNTRRAAVEPLRATKQSSPVAECLGDVECQHCGAVFVDGDAYDRHCPDGKQCVKPTDVGLVVSTRVRLTWSVPVKVPVEFDIYGEPTKYVDASPDVAGQWDDRCWRDHP